MQLRDSQPVLHGEEARRMSEDSLLLGTGAGEYAGIVGYEEARQTEGVGHVEEVRRLVSGIAIDGSRNHARVVGHDGDTAAAQEGKGSHD